MELIYKDKLLKAIDDCDYCRNCRFFRSACICDEDFKEEAIINLIKDTHAVDAVEVVRCKDCKHWFSNVAGYTGEEIGHCEWAGWMVGKNGYCVYGERKEVQE